MANELPPLVQRVEADLSSLERGLDRAGQQVEQFGRDGAKAGEKAARGFERALDTVNSNARLSANQLRNLGYQANDVFTSLGSGAPVLQVLAQQGGQVYQALADTPGGAAAGVKDLARRTAGLLTPARLVAGGMVGIGAAAALLGVRWDNAQSKIELGLSGVGKASGATVRQINEISAAAASSGRMTASAAREAATAIATTGKVDASNIPAILDLAPGYAKLFGKDMAEAGTDLARIFADPVKGADELDARLGILDDRTRQYIRTLAAQGDRQGAIRTLAQLAQPELDRVAAKTSLWARAWNSVEAAADAAGRAVVQATTGGSIDDRLREAERRRSSASAAAAQSGNANPVDQSYVDELRRRGLTDRQIQQEVNPIAPGAVDNARGLAKALADAEAQAEDLNEQARRQSAQSFNDTENAIARDRSKQAGEATRAVNTEAESIEALENRYKALKAATESNRAAGMLDNADQARASVDALGQRLQQLKEDYAAGGSAAAAAVRAANFQQATAGLAAYARGLMEINQRFDELRRNAVATTDAAKLPEALRTLEASRTAATAAYNTETRRQAVTSTTLPAGYVDSIIKPESGGDPTARNPRSTATGLGQFIESTWLDVIQKIRPQLYGALGAAETAESRKRILALRTDPELNREAIGELGRQNAVKLQDAGFEASLRNLHLAHFLGAQGAVSILRADPSANAAGVLPGAAAANPEVFKRGNATVQDILNYGTARATGSGPAGQAAQERIRQTQLQTAEIGKSVTETERLQAAERLLAEDRKQGGDISREFASATDLLTGSNAKLTPELEAQRAAFLKLVDAEAAAVKGRQQSQFSLDLRDQYGALGRTPGEQQDFLTARRFGAEGSDEFNKAYGQLQDLRDLTTTKADAGGFLKSINSDLLRGASLADAMSNALSGLIAKMGDRAIDTLLNMAFGSNGGGGAGGGGAGGLIGSLIGALSGSGAVKAATGGRVSGPGSGTSDSIAARLSNGEYVVNAASTRANLPLLEAINSGRARRFATGGLVGAMPSVAAARPAFAGGGTFNLIDQRPAGSPDLAPTSRRNSSGGTDVILRQAESGLAGRGRRGQGPLASVFNSAATRNG
ncbi:phage tail length tape measure family protein [Methylobacterium tarhaniae]|uniref:phage tail length tape measure family protein n=1 Tax=Methylobacterium tarhaniae TaxID=1187852 RepID=UPI003CFE2523